jgi:anti-anti-sigma factor
MNITDSLIGDIVLIELSGKIMGGDEITRLHGKTHYYLGLSKNKFLLDLEKLTWSNSIGIGALIMMRASVKKAEGKLVLANVTNLKDLLVMTGLLRFFEVYDSRAEAMKALSEPGPLSN